jgi:hypothetical protein
MTAPIYDETMKNGRMTATRDAVAAGDVQLLTDADAVLVTFPLSASGGSVASSRWTFSFGAGSTAGHTAVATGTGIAARCRIRNSGGTVRITGLTVGLELAGVLVDNTSINTNQNVTLLSAYIDHAPDPA